MSDTITVDRGEKRAIIVQIKDTLTNSLLSKRVTWAVAKLDGTQVLKKTGALPPANDNTSAEVVITSRVAAQLDGFVNLLPADYASLPDGRYITSLWIDSASNPPDDECVTAGGSDTLIINPTAPRT